MRKIDRTPPRPTGDTQVDINAIITYLHYLREQINFIITNIERREGTE